MLLVPQIYPLFSVSFFITFFPRMKCCVDVTAELVSDSVTVFLFTWWWKPLFWCPDCVILHSDTAKSHQAEKLSATDSGIPLNAASQRMINRCSGVLFCFFPVGESVSLTVWHLRSNRPQSPPRSLRCFSGEGNQLLCSWTYDHIQKFIVTHGCYCR